MFSLKLSLLISLTLVNAAPFLSNGNDAQIAEFPYLVSIQEINVHIGHGSMLNEKWILSCARVFTGKRIADLNIEYGNTVITPGPNTENDVRISHVLVHEHFNVPTPFANDVSLIESDTSISIHLHQPFAKLVISGGSRFLSGRQSTFASWGHIAPGNTRTRQLQKADLSILSHEECVVAVDDSQQPSKQNICAIGESVMCIADLGKNDIINEEHGSNIKFQAHLC